MKKYILCAVLISLVSSSAIAAMPQEIKISEDKTRLEKVYELSYDAAEEIPTDTFEQNGFRYTLSTISKEDVEGEETRIATEPTELYSKTSNIESVLGEFDREISVSYDDGFSGIIPLDLDSFKVESLGSGTSVKTVTQSRTYPNLANADMKYIPKTLEHSGATLALSSVNWQTDNTQNIDNYAVPDRYSAVVTYSGEVKSSYSKGYKITGEYRGEVAKKAVKKIRWTAVFSGEEIKTPWGWSVAGIAIATALIAGGYILIRKGRKNNDKPKNKPKKLKNHNSVDRGAANARRW